MAKQVVFSFLKKVFGPHTCHAIYAALGRVRMEIRMNRRHRRAVKKARRYADARDLRLHLGSGKKNKEGFINIDMRPDVGADLVLDLRRPLPFPDNCCRGIYCEHTLEHVSYPDTHEAFLREVLRVLSPGGEFLLSVPDLDLFVQDFKSPAEDGVYSQYRRAWKDEECLPIKFDTDAEYLNFLFNQFGEHEFIHDEKTLTLFLESLGFVNVQRRAFDPAMDSPSRRYESLLMTAEKP
jgi:predicted SAM-dependent methyltransferase